MNGFIGKIDARAERHWAREDGVDVTGAAERAVIMCDLPVPLKKRKKKNKGNVSNPEDVFVIFVDDIKWTILRGCVFSSLERTMDVRINYGLEMRLGFSGSKFRVARQCSRYKISSERYLQPRTDQLRIADLGGPGKLTLSVKEKSLHPK